MIVTEDSGTLALGQDTLSYRSQFYGHWELVVANLVLVGEFTNQDGPHLADHFVVFVCKGMATYEAPVSAAGWESVAAGLAERFGIRIELTLEGETDFASNVVWPEEMRNRPLLSYSDKPPKSAWGRLLGRFGCGTMESRYTSEVEEFCRVGDSGGHSD